MPFFFIRRPIVAIVISIIIVIFGIVASLTLPVALFPNIVPPEIMISGVYPGADAKTVEQSVATPIEQQMSGVDFMNYMYSTNSNDGKMTMRVVFEPGSDANMTQVLAQMRKSQAEPQLPVEVKNAGVTVQKSTSAPLMLISLYSPNGAFDATFLANYAYVNLNDQLLRIRGIGQVTVFGAGQYAMRLWVKPDRLAALNITVPEIIDAIQTQNTVNPAGKIGGEPIPPGQEFAYTVRAQGRLVTEEEFGAIVVRSNPDGSLVRLRDVARMELGSQDYNNIGRYNGKPSGVVALYQTPGSNAIEAVDAVNRLMVEEAKRFPPGLEYAVSLDTTQAVRAGMKEIVKTLFEAFMLVIIVVYIFLQGFRATLIPLLAVPVSLIGTFAIFPMLGFSINSLSLFGLVLAIGIVVDDAIVVVEAVEHNIEHGLSPVDATVKAMKEVSGPVVAIALVLVAVFVPTIFIPGITGSLYQQFAVTVAVSTIISAFNALSLSPALSAMLLRPRTPAKGLLGRFFNWFNRNFGRATDGYVSVCGRAIRKVIISMIFIAVAAVGTGMLGKSIPTGFLPEEDQGYFYANLSLPNAASIERASEASRKVEKRLQEIPGIEGVTTVAGYSLLSGVASTYNSFFFVTLKHWDQRKTKEEQYQVIMNRVNSELSQIPEGVAFAFSPPAIPGVGTSGGVTMVLEDRSGKGADFLAANMKTFMQKAKERPEIASITTQFSAEIPQIFADVNRDKVLKQGIELSQVYKTLQTFMGGYMVNFFNRFGRSWQVVVQAEGEYRTKAEDVGNFYVRNKNGDPVPLSALVSIQKTQGPEFLMRFNLYSGAQLNVTAAPGFSSAQVMRALEEVFRQSMPPEMGYDYIGMSFQELKAQQGISPAAIFALSLLFVFLILAAQYESWSLPFSVLLAIPIAVLGAFAALAARGFENNVYAQIGLVVLIGLASKNAILIVEFAKEGVEKGKGLVEAALEAAKLRLRPILMTAFAFILGCVPLWKAQGAGALSRQILGSAVIGGMLAASLIAIFLVPVSFYAVEKIAGKKPKAATEPQPQEATH